MKKTEPELPLISVILPAYNEQALLEDHVARVIDYLRFLEASYRWEVLIINDGSADRTGEIANRLADRYPNVRALHHPRNFGLGQVLKFGFANSRGDYIVTLDVDLSYSPEHIEELVGVLRSSHAKIVVASPYRKGGTIKNVPLLRRTLSILGNRFLRIFARGHLSTLTSLVRAYDGPFIRSLDLRSMGMEIMPETLYKAMVLRARIEDMPARLDWSRQQMYAETRASSMRITPHVVSTVLSSFVFRPFMFFVFPGILVGAFALYVDFWMFVHFFSAVMEFGEGRQEYAFGAAFALAYNQSPHTFVTAFLSTMLAIQLLGMGVLALQNKRCFEDLFHLGSTSLRNLRRPVE